MRQNILALVAASAAFVCLSGTSALAQSGSAQFPVTTPHRFQVKTLHASSTATFQPKQEERSSPVTPQRQASSNCQCGITRRFLRGTDFFTRESLSAAIQTSAVPAQVPTFPCKLFRLF